MTSEAIVPGLHVPSSEPLPESRFTGATDICPRPDYYTSYDGDSTECEVAEMLGGFVRGLQPEYILETGTAFGITTSELAKAIIINQHGHLVSIDNDPERIEFTQVRLEAEGLNHRVTLLEKNSLDWSPPLDCEIGFAFFDSLYELRVPEFLHFRPFLKKGTIVAFHDTAPEHGSHRIESGRDLRTEIEVVLGAQLRLTHFPTPRGLTVGEVL